MGKKLFEKRLDVPFSPLIDVVMNGLGAVFVLLMIYMIVVRPDDIIDQIIKRGQEVVKNSLDESLSAYGYNHRIDGHNQIISFQSEILFDLGRWKLKERGMTVLSALSRSLRKYQGKIYDPEADAGFFSTISIDGHTDTLAIKGGAVETNWHLSSLRAISVLQYLEDEKVNPKIMSPTGYADTRLVEPRGDDPKNRRVEITLIYSRQAIGEILKKLGRFKKPEGLASN